MSKRTYPRIGSTRRWYGKPLLSKKCAVCNQRSPDTLIDVQVNWFRGDDDRYFVHATCVKNLRQESILHHLQA